MILAQLTTLDPTGVIQQETVLATSRDDLQQLLKNHKATVIRHNVVKSTSFSKISQKEKSNFFLKLSVLLHAGEPLACALYNLEKSAHSKPMRYLLMLIRAQLESGVELIECFRAHSKVFDSLTLSILDQSLKTGQLEAGLLKVHAYLVQKEKYRSQLKQVTFYPLFLLTAIVGLFALFTQFLLPEVVLYLKEMGLSELPLASRTLISLTAFFENYSVSFCLFLISIAVIYFLFLTSSFVQKKLTPLLLKIPSMGVFYGRFQTMPWLSVVGELYGAGVPFKESLDQSVTHIKNASLRNTIEMMHKDLLEGKSMEETMADTGFFSPFARSLCSLGMKSGRLAEFFKKAYQMERDDIHETLVAFLKKLEPCLIVTMGLLLLWIVAGVILPLYTHMNV